ncbi:MAG: hypothetical protein JAY75_17190, partial [Candidatus Thiodiazotropha taylori]|nr:hypothetical protein [Candidatus Thiodiazotropha taylori]MCW4309952.1 hypothetical protein [Candidatus Thiodiazotropha endolucinida]
MMFLIVNTAVRLFNHLMTSLARDADALGSTKVEKEEVDSIVSPVATLPHSQHHLHISVNHYINLHSQH